MYVYSVHCKKIKRKKVEAKRFFWRRSRDPSRWGGSSRTKKKGHSKNNKMMCFSLCTNFVQILFEEHRPPKSHVSRHPQPLDNYEKAERVWERLLSAHSLGDCLITVATSEIDRYPADSWPPCRTVAYMMTCIYILYIAELPWAPFWCDSPNTSLNQSSLPIFLFCVQQYAALKINYLGRPAGPPSFVQPLLAAHLKFSLQVCCTCYIYIIRYVLKYDVLSFYVCFFRERWKDTEPRVLLHLRACVYCVFLVFARVCVCVCTFLFGLGRDRAT